MTLTEYLEPTDSNAFLDYPLMERTKYTPDHYEICSKCHGHGGWNLRINAYKLPQGVDNTSENRHKYVHFRSLCNVCNGWGYTDNQCDHEFVHLRNLGNCYNEYKCVKCGTIQAIDSSD